jgi:hypothetical protein
VGGPLDDAGGAARAAPRPESGPEDPHPGEPPGLGDPDWTDPAGWSEAGAGSDPFPPTLELGVSPADGGPWPADGGPWVEPDLLGGPGDRTAGPSGPDLVLPTDPPAALLSDLAAADGDPEAGWDEVHGSDDPAVRALAARWHS